MSAFVKVPAPADPRQDEYQIDQDDPAEFALLRWNEIVTASAQKLKGDANEVSRKREWETAQRTLADKTAKLAQDLAMKRLLMQLQPVPRSWASMTGLLMRDVQPKVIDLSIMWGLFILNLNLSVDSIAKMQLTTDWLIKLRRCAERFIRCYNMCTEKGESLIAFIDVLDHFVFILCENARYLRRYATDEDEEALKDLKEIVISHLAELDEVTKHLQEIAELSGSNESNKISNVVVRSRLQGGDDANKEKYPILHIPYEKDPNFYGRSKELAKIDRFLRRDPSNVAQSALRTATIYGRRGGGKTSLALEYAHRNPSKYQLVFWVRCETKSTLRQSFTDIAVALDLPGADRIGKHEECQIQVLQYLRTTNATWLLIFDNCDKESEVALKGYWPLGAEGAILITSRNYYNFLRDEHRKLITIEPFRPPEDFELLFTLLGKDWQDELREGKISDDDIDTIKTWLECFEGLPLSISTAATLLSKRRSKGESVFDTYNAFRVAEQSLPERQRASRSPMIQNLDAVFNMTFSTLSKHARDLLQVLALLSPDEIRAALFLPQNQSALEGKLAFAKQQHPVYVNGSSEITSASRTQITAELNHALVELEKGNLIRWDGRILSIHREIQEAMNYLSNKELQESFNTCVHLVYEAFPKQKAYNTLYDEWQLCGAYINHVIHLSKKFREYLRPDAGAPLVATHEFIELLQNATWYLYDIGDYDTSKDIVDVGCLACGFENDPSAYARFCLTQGCNYYDLNRMDDCRRNWKQALVLQRKMKHDTKHVDIACSLSNLGNLESATNNFEQAFEYFNESVTIRLGIGKSAEIQLGNTYLGLGRLHALQRNFAEARRFFNMGETLYLRTEKPERLYMAHYFYAYANCDYEEGLYSQARRGFDACLERVLVEMPVHPLTCATYFSLGCTDYRMGQIQTALINFKKARSIAELRSPSRCDGTMARIYWWTAQVLKEDITGAGLKEANELLQRAYTARAALILSKEAADSESLVDRLSEMEPERTDLQLEEESFDQLVPGFYR